MNEKRLKEIKARKLEIRKLLESDAKDLKLEELEKELKELDVEQVSIEKRLALLESFENNEETQTSTESQETRTIEKPLETS